MDIYRIRIVVRRGYVAVSFNLRNPDDQSKLSRVGQRQSGRVLNRRYATSRFRVDTEYLLNDQGVSKQTQAGVNVTSVEETWQYDDTVDTVGVEPTIPAAGTTAKDVKIEKPKQRTFDVF